MELVAPDILSEVCALSLGLKCTGLGLGILLWIFGWRWHRFWVVLGATVLGGIVGLLEAGTWNTHPLVAAVLIAVASGLMALSIIRMVAFSAGGFLGLMLAQWFLPQWNQPLLIFVGCGLVSLLLFRWCLMALTSLLGTTLIAYCGLGLLHHYGRLDAVAWVEQSSAILGWLGLLIAGLGFFVQIVLYRQRTRRRKRGRDEDSSDEDVATRLLGKLRRAG